MSRVAPGGRGSCRCVAVLSRFYPPEYSGAAIQLARLIEKLSERGWEFDILTPDTKSSSATREPSQRIRVHRFRVPRSGLARELVFGVRAALWLLLHSRWRLLHSIDFSHCSLGPWAVARVRRRPVLVKKTLLERDDAQSFGARLLRRVRAIGYGHADALIALSDDLERHLREDYRTRGRILRIPNGVDVERFRPPVGSERDAGRTALDVAEDAFVPVLCGMRIARKNPVALIEAAGRMRHRPVHVLLIGPEGDDPGYERRIQAAIRALPEGVQATVLEHLAPEEVAQALRVGDAYVLPSAGEGLPNSVLEAMATGLPCIATDIPGSRDVLEHGGGLLVESEDPRVLAAALDRLASSPQQRSELGSEGRRVIEERFALGQVADLYAGAYADLLGRPSLAPRS